jgi:hypothetical protein
MTKRKATGAAKKKMPSHPHGRKSKSVPLSGPKDPVKRFVPKAVAEPVRREKAAAKTMATKTDSAEGPTSLFEAQVRLFQSMVRWSPLGYFMRVQELAREAAAKPESRSA